VPHPTIHPRGHSAKVLLFRLLKMHRKGGRTELDALFESAWEGQQKRKKWAEMHPSTDPGKVPSVQRSRTGERGWWWHLWEVFAVVVGTILALEATSVWPLLYWPGVFIVYCGLLGIVVDALRGKWHWHWASRGGIAAIGVIFLACWTFKFVFAKAKIDATSLANPGDLRLYLINSTDHDFDNVSMSVSSDNIISRIAQLEPVCQNFNFFSETRPTYMELRDNATGKTMPTLQSGPGLSTRGRLMCGELPHHSAATFAVALMATDIGKNPQNPFPQRAIGPARMPKWFRIDGDYRALGKTRPIQFKWTY
jgi:hypothetical protein